MYCLLNWREQFFSGGNGYSHYSYELTRFDVDVSAGPESITAGPFVGLPKQSDGAVFAGEVLRQLHRVRLGGDVVFHEVRLRGSRGQVQDLSLQMVQNLKLESSLERDSSLTKCMIINR